MGVNGPAVDVILRVEQAAIFATGIGLDRTLGYGLKLPTGFRDTHLGRIGKG